MISATRREPVKATLSTPGWVASASPSERSVAGQAADDAGGQARPVGDLADRAGGQRRLLGGLDDHAAAGRERGRELPDHERHGEVPGRDRGDDADPVGPDLAAAPAGAGRQELAPESLGLAGEMVDDLAGARDLGLGLAERLALLAVDELGDPAGLVIEGPRKSGDRLAALERWRPAPPPRASRAAATAAIDVGRSWPRRPGRWPRPCRGR